MSPRSWRLLIVVLIVLAGSMLPAASVAQTVVKYVHTDALGSVVAMTDQSRNVLERREYEPYGEQLTPAVQGGPGYTGHVQDATTGLVYMQQRYYDPQIGLFLSVDPVAADGSTGGNFNRYKYAANNPYRFIDPDGRFESSVTRAFERDARAVLTGAMSQEKFNTHLQARGGGVAVGAVAVTGGVVAIKSGLGAAVLAGAARAGAAAESASLSTGLAAQRAVNGVANGLRAADTATTGGAVRAMVAVESEVALALSAAGANPATSSAIASQVATPAAAAEFISGAAQAVSGVQSAPSSPMNALGTAVGTEVRNAMDGTTKDFDELRTR